MHCIKCGREIPEGELFCVECSMAPEPPEPVRPAELAKDFDWAKVPAGDITIDPGQL